MNDLTIRAGLLIGVVLLATAGGFVARRRAGRVREVTDGQVLSSAELASPLGARATLVQFSSPACSPCRAVHQILDGVVAQAPDLRHVEIDASARLDLASRLGIMRTPTVLVLDPGGRVIRRMAGLLDADQVRTAVPEPIRSRS